MTNDSLRVIATDAAPGGACRMKGSALPALTLMGEHDLCPGCGEPLALRQILDSIEAAKPFSQLAIGVIGIGCYTALTSLMDIDLIQALHGRAPSVATGAKRMRPENLIFTLQGDGDMVNEGLQEVIHTAARGENVTCILLEQWRIRRDRRAHDRHDGARPTHEEFDRWSRRCKPRLSDSDRRPVQPPRRHGLRSSRLGSRCSRRRQSAAFHRPSVSITNEGSGILFRRDPDDVSDRLVHPDGRRARDISTRNSVRSMKWAS